MKHHIAEMEVLVVENTKLGNEKSNQQQRIDGLL